MSIEQSWYEWSVSNINSFNNNLNNSLYMGLNDLINTVSNIWKSDKIIPIKDHKYRTTLYKEDGTLLAIGNLQFAGELFEDETKHYFFLCTRNEYNSIWKYTETLSWERWEPDDIDDEFDRKIMEIVKIPTDHILMWLSMENKYYYPTLENFSFENLKNDRF